MASRLADKSRGNAPAYGIGIEFHAVSQGCAREDRHVPPTVTERGSRCDTNEVAFWSLGKVVPGGVYMALGWCFAVYCYLKAKKLTRR